MNISIQCDLLPNIPEREQCTDLVDCDDSMNWCNKATMNPYETGEEIAILLLTLACLVVLASITAYIVKNRESKIVKVSPFVYLMAIATGYASLLIAQVVWPFESTVALCFLKPWFLAIGYGLIVGSMLVRIFRTYYLLAQMVDPNRSMAQMLNKEKTDQRRRSLKKIFACIVLIEVVLIGLMESIPATRPDLVLEYCSPEQCGNTCYSETEPSLCTGRIFTRCRLNAGFGYFAFIVNTIPLCFGIYWVVKILQVRRRVHKAAVSKERDVGHGDGLTNTDRSVQLLEEQLTLLRPTIYMIIVVGVVGIVLVAVSYTDLPTRSTSARHAYYISRGICFLFTIMSTMFLSLSPVLLGIYRAKHPSDTTDNVESIRDGKGSLSRMKKPWIQLPSSFILKDLGTSERHSASIQSGIDQSRREATREISPPPSDTSPNKSVNTETVTII